MAIPNFQSFMLPVLRLAACAPIRTTEAIACMSDEFSLTETERNELLASGRQTRVANRVYWTLVHLTKADLLKREVRGLYTISDEGRRVLAENPSKIDMNFLLARSEKYRQFRSVDSAEPEGDGTATVTHVDGSTEPDTPEERIDAAFIELNNTLQSELYERVLSMEDSDFERLIVALMLGLGYGDGAGGLGKRTGGSGDGAIDGIITEDLLGLDVIYLQAKRYAQDSVIGPDKIREFAGAMDAHGVTKGVFVTTSRYTKSALEYAERSHKRLRLIDGKELTRLMVKHGIGVREHRTLKLQKIDAGFFEGLAE